MIMHCSNIVKNTGAKALIYSTSSNLKMGLPKCKVQAHSLIFHYKQ